MTSFKHILSTGLILLLSACGGGGSGDGGSAVTPTLPSDAVAITASNANGIAISAVSSVDTGSILLGVEASIPASQLAINTLTEYVFKNKNRSYSVVAGITVTENCPGGGTATDTYTESATSVRGSVRFNQCDLAVSVLDGSFSYSSTWNNSTGDYIDSGNGSLTFTAGTDTYTMVMDLTEAGNENTGSYSMSLSFSISGSNIGGYLVETIMPLQGIYPGDITTGQLIVTGADGTRLRVTITSSTTADVEIDNGDGNFVFHSQIFV